MRFSGRIGRIGSDFDEFDNAFGHYFSKKPAKGGSLTDFLKQRMLEARQKNGAKLTDTEKEYINMFGIKDKEASTKLGLKAFFAGYLSKQAGITDAVVDTAGWAADKTWTAALVAPALAGVAGGALASKLTSPGNQKDVIQKALIAAELEEQVAEMKRKQRLEQLKEQLKYGDKTERSLHL